MAHGDVVRTFSAPTRAPHHATYPLGLGYDGAALYIANIQEAANPLSPFALFGIDPIDGAYEQRIDYPTINQTLKDLAWDGQWLWAINADRRRQKVDPDDGTNIDGYATLTQRSRGIAWDHACGHMWELVLERGDLGQSDTLINALPTRDIELRTQDGDVAFTVATVSEHQFWYGLAYDGCTLWTVDRLDLELVRIDPTTGGEVERLPTPDAKPIGVAFDGRDLVVSDNGTDAIYVIEIGPVADINGGECVPGWADAQCHVPGIPTVEDPNPPSPPDDEDPGSESGGSESESGGSDGEGGPESGTSGEASESTTSGGPGDTGETGTHDSDGTTMVTGTQEAPPDTIADVGCGCTAAPRPVWALLVLCAVAVSVRSRRRRTSPTARHPRARPD